MSILRGVSSEIDIPITVYCARDMGKTLRIGFVIRVKKPNHDECKQVIQKATDKTLVDDELLDEYLLGWSGLEGNEGAVAYTPENREEVLNAPEYRSEIIDAISSIIRGGKTGVAKNS